MSSRTSSRLEDMRVLDCDFHLTEKTEDYVPYATGSFGKQLKNSPDHHTHGLYPSPGLYSNTARGYNESREVTEKEQVVAAMEEFYLDRVILSPTKNLYLSCIQHDELAATLANAYNEWLLEEFVDADEDIYSSILVAPQKPQRAAEEIDERASESEFVSVFFPVGGIEPLAGNSDYHPIYEACQDHDLPLVMHAASGNMSWAFPHVNKMFNRLMPTHLTSHPMIHMTNLADVITRGIPVRFPDLKLVVQEAGLGWIPYFLRRFDHEYRNNREDAPMLEKLPSEYILDQCYFTSQPIEGARDLEYITSMIELFEGEENLLFSSDYPHFDFDNSDELLKALARFDDDAIENIYSGTALDVYNFG